jgi:hypothetical protein
MRIVITGVPGSPGLGIGQCPAREEDAQGEDGRESTDSTSHNSRSLNHCPPPFVNSPHTSRTEETRRLFDC